MTLWSFTGGSLFADVVGQGSPLVVLLHGWGRDRKDLIGATSGDFSGTTASFDLPGFGTSPPPPTAWGAREYARLLGQAIVELRTTARFELANAPVLLVGHSFGGRVALCLAAEAPWISGLILSGVPLLRSAPKRPAFRFRFLRLLSRRSLISNTRMEKIRQRYGSEDYRTAQGVMRETLVRVVGETYENELKMVCCPTRFIWGELDTETLMDVAHKAIALVTAPYEFISVNDAGHDVHRTHPEVLQREIVQLCELLLT